MALQGDVEKYNNVGIALAP